MIKPIFFLHIVAVLCLVNSALSADVSGLRVIFDSNSAGTFGVYTSKLDGSDRRVVFDSEDNDIYPVVAPDNKTIAFARQTKTKKSSVWLSDIDGSNVRMLVDDASFPSFSADGKKVFFLRQRRAVFSISVDGGKADEIFPKGKAPFAGREIAVPRVSPDEKYIAFTVDLPSKWKTWVYEFQTGEHFMIGHGCEPIWESDSIHLHWVERGRFQSKSAISRFNVLTRENVVAQDHAEPFGQEYFPSTSPDDSYLVWAACPVTQHNHDTSNYQLFYKAKGATERIRISNDAYTNRWPKLYVVQP